MLMNVQAEVEEALQADSWTPEPLAFGIPVVDGPRVVQYWRSAINYYTIAEREVSERNSASRLVVYRQRALLARILEARRQLALQARDRTVRRLERDVRMAAFDAGVAMRNYRSALNQQSGIADEILDITVRIHEQCAALGVNSPEELIALAMRNRIWPEEDEDVVPLPDDTDRVFDVGAFP